MPLSDFFRINLPYGIRKNSSNAWFAFNREYLPLGWNSESWSEIGFTHQYNSECAKYTFYPELTDDTILRLVTDPNAITRNKAGKIEWIFFYDDKTNPITRPEHWDKYLSLIREFSRFTIC